MGSAASVSDASRPERPEGGDAEPEPRRSSSPVGRSDATLQVRDESKRSMNEDKQPAGSVRDQWWNASTFTRVLYTVKYNFQVL